MLDQPLLDHPLPEARSAPAATSDAHWRAGALVEYVEGKSAVTHRAGDSWTEGKDTNHWAENNGSEPAVVLAVDVFKP